MSDNPQYVRNPNSGRAIKVGSRVYMSLVKQGTIDREDYSHPDEIQTIEDDRPMEQQVDEANDKLEDEGDGEDFHAVQGRGQHSGMFVKRRKRISNEKVARKTAKAATRAVSNNIGRLTEVEDIEAELERLIMEELAFGSSKAKKPRPPKTRPQSRPKTAPARGKKKSVGWVVQDSESSEDDSEAEFEDSEDDDDDDFEW
jgi:hypothetical protein